MVYCKGGLSWAELQEMPLTQVADLVEYTDKINKIEENLINDRTKRGK